MSKRKTHSTKGLRPPAKHSTKEAVKIYWPYLPLLLVLFGAMVINGLRSFTTNTFNGNTLAYATEISRSALLASTNDRRSANGVSSLSLNSLLNQAAQNKAIDMRNRNYWSHNTPDGQQPWVFIDAVSYVYTKAGENLAYGYSTSDATVTGWMNSPSHKANMLDSTFTEVGFGFVNAEDFNNSGNQTIVVAMYAKPYATSATSPVPTPEPTPEVSQEVQSNTVENSQEEVVSDQSPEQPVTNEDMNLDVVIDDTVMISDSEPITTESSDEIISNAEPVRTTLLTQLTSGKYLWATTAVSLAGFALSMLWIIKHGIAIRKIIVSGEHFVAHHPVFDLIVVSIVVLVIYLTQGSGVVL